MTEPILAKDEVLERVDGDVNFLAELTNEFLASFPDRLAELVVAANQKDATQTEHMAHSIKGALRNLGGMQSGAKAHQIEIAAKQGDLSQTTLMLQQLEQSVKEFELEFKRFLGSL